MQLLEFQAKQMLISAGLLVPHGTVIEPSGTPPEAPLPAVVKSQVPTGGRGKLGGIRLVRNKNELKEAISDIAALSIKGYRPSHLLIEEALHIERELYISLQVNRDDRRIEWIASENGGVEIESHSGSSLVVPANNPRAYDKIASILDVSKETLVPLLDALYRCFCDNDLLLLEINPLVITTEGALVCADAKLMVDDNARFRHPHLDWPSHEALKPLGGTIGVIANGAGMAMSTMDSIYDAGGKPANFLDIGGGTGEHVFITNLRHINNLPGVTCIIVNIFAGITRCDDIARGIIAAKEQIPQLVPMFIRLEGTNQDEAAKLLAQAGIALQPDLKTCIELALRSEGKNEKEPETYNQQPTRERKEKQKDISSAPPLSSMPLRFPQQRGDTDNQVEPDGIEMKDSTGLESNECLFTNQPAIVQGITGHHGLFHTEKMLANGTNIVAGVTPGRGAQTVHGLPVYNTVEEAVQKHQALSSIVFVPAPFAKAAVFEAIEAGIKLVVIITEGIPVHDMLSVHEKSVATGVTVVGPNCPGLIVPGSHKYGIIAAHITSPGHATVISRSGTLTYELAAALTRRGIGQRLILGIGGDPVQGMTFVEALKIAEADPGTEQILLVGEIGGEGEIRAADYIDEHVTKPVYGLVVGHSLPSGQTFGHAGAIVSAKAEDAATKTAYLASRGTLMTGTIDELIREIHP